MSGILRVHWTIDPTIPPRPWLPCDGCHDVRPFSASGRFRLNANGKTLDAWLIYGCTTCGATWNRPVLMRRRLRETDARTVAALHANDPALARRIAFDVAGLRRSTHRIDPAAGIAVRKAVVAPTPDVVAAVHIRISVTHVVGLRIDRLLAGEFGVSRTRIAELNRAGGLVLSPRIALRRPVRDGTLVALDRPAAACIDVRSAGLPLHPSRA